MSEPRLPLTVSPAHYEFFVRPDVAQRTFAGFVDIRIQVHAPVTTIVLNAHRLNILSVALIQARDAVSGFALNAAEQILDVKLKRTLSPGSYNLQIDYTGEIGTTAEGLFLVTYGAGNASRMLLTQCEPVSARRLLPCWDEPARKATFVVSLISGANELAVSNMPIEQIAEVESGLRRVRFQMTPRMSIYLIFIAIGEFERLSEVVGSTTVSIVARKGSASKGRFALDSAVRLLTYYNDYFATPYPLPKLDLVAAPSGGDFSAMENWGAILYFERVLLLDPATSSEADRQSIHVVVAHEMAHQWFGNLVTMQWWDNLWLNEGFASWMENKATDHFHPEWQQWLQSEAQRQRAMRRDAQRTSHAVVQEISSSDEAEEAFDDITYLKGQAVIRMLEDYVGEDLFKKGVQSYMRRYAYQNCITHDLWQEIERASGKPIAALADEYTLRPGLPLLLVDRAEHETDATVTETSATVTLRQRQFHADAGSEQLAWHVPVGVAAVGLDPTFALVSSAAPHTVRIANNGPVKVNVGQKAYCRVQYSAALRSALFAALGDLAPIDQLGLLYDTWALARAGIYPVGDYLEAVVALAPAAEPTVWKQVVATLLSIDRLYDRHPGQMAFRMFARRSLAAVFTRVGWAKKAVETDGVAVLRGELLGAMGRFDDAVAAEALARFARFVTRPEDPAGLPSNVRRTALEIVAYRAGRDSYDTLHRLARLSSDPAWKTLLYEALAVVSDPALAAESLAIAISAEPPKGMAPDMIGSTASGNPDLAWTFVTSKRDMILPLLDNSQRNSFVPSIGAQSSDPRRLPELRAYIDRYVDRDARKGVEKYVADLEQNIAETARLLPQIDAWLAKRPQ